MMNELDNTILCSCGCEDPLTDAELRLVATQLRFARALDLLERMYYCTHEVKTQRAVAKFLAEQCEWAAPK